MKTIYFDVRNQLVSFVDFIRNRKIPGNVAD